MDKKHQTKKLNLALENDFYAGYQIVFYETII